MEKRVIILIGGAPTAGKSTMAQLLSERLQLPWVSTDQIREVMRTATRRVDSPNLFTPEGFDTAEKFLTHFTAEEIADMEMQQANAVWPGVKKLVLDDYTWRNGFIIEGVNITPKLVAEDFNQISNVHSVFLIDEDADRTKKVVYERGLWDDADSYSDKLKPKEVEWTVLFSKKLRQEAEKYNLPWIEVEKGNDDVQKVLTALGLE
jgi:2-phosphoglycerate kinase